MARNSVSTMRAAIGLAGLLFLAGCGSDQLPTAPVSGTVTFNDKPLVGGGTITFVPTGKGKGAGGIINDDGTYTLNTYGDGDGAILGDHKVRIQQKLVLKQAVWPEVPDGQEPPLGQKPISPEETVPQADRIPTKYAGSESPLEATVVEGTNTFDFDLEP